MSLEDFKVTGSESGGPTENEGAKHGLVTNGKWNVKDWITEGCGEVINFGQVRMRSLIAENLQ